MKRRIIVTFLVLAIVGIALLLTQSTPDKQRVLVTNMGPDISSPGQWIFRIENQGPATIILADHCFFEVKNGIESSLVLTNNGTPFWVLLPLSNRTIRNGKAVDVSVPNPRLKKIWRPRIHYRMPFSLHDQWVLVRNMAMMFIRGTLKHGAVIAEGPPPIFVSGEWIAARPKQDDLENDELAAPLDGADKPDVRDSFNDQSTPREPR